MKRTLSLFLSLVMVITSFATVSFTEAFAADDFVQPQGNHTTVLSEVDIASATLTPNTNKTSMNTTYTTRGSVAMGSSKGVWNTRSSGTATDDDGNVFKNLMTGAVVNTGDISETQYPDINEFGNIPAWKATQGGPVTVLRFNDMAGSAGWGFEAGDKILFTIRVYLGDIKSKGEYTTADGQVVPAAADTTTKYIDTKSFIRRQGNTSTSLSDADEATHYIPVNRWYTITRSVTVTEALLNKYNIMEGIGLTFKNTGGIASSYSKPYPATVFISEAKVEKFEDTSMIRNTSLINYHEDFEDLIISDMSTESNTYPGTYGTTTLLMNSQDRFNYKNIAVNDSGNTTKFVTATYSDGTPFTYAASTDIGVVTTFGQGVSGAAIYAANENSVIQTPIPSAKSMYDISQGVQGAEEVKYLTPMANTGTQSIAFSRMLRYNSAIRFNGIFGFHPVAADKDRTFRISFWVYPDSTQGAHNGELLNGVTAANVTYKDVRPVDAKSGTPKLQVHMNGPAGQWYKYRNSSSEACRVWAGDLPWDKWTKVEFEYTIGEFYDNGDTDASKDTNPLKNCLQINQGNTNLVADTMYYDDFSVVEITKHTVNASSSDDAMGLVTGGGKFGDGETATLTATAKEGYSFAGWYKGDELVSENAEYSFEVKETVTLVAKFKAPVNYTLTVSSEDEDMGSVSGEGSFGDGEKVTVTATPNYGYQLDGWYKGDTLVSKKLNYTFRINENTSLVAKFSEYESDGFVTSLLLGCEGENAAGQINGFGNTDVKNNNFNNEETTYEAIGETCPSELITGEDFGEGVYDFDANTITEVIAGTETWKGPLKGRFTFIPQEKMPLTSNTIRISMWVKYAESKNDVDDTAKFAFTWTTTSSPTNDTNITSVNPDAKSPNFVLKKGEWTKITHTFNATADDLKGKYGILFNSVNTDTDAPSRFLIDNVRFENLRDVKNPEFTVDVTAGKIVCQAIFKRDDLVGKKYNYLVATYDALGKMTDLKLSQDEVIEQHFNKTVFETPLTSENQRFGAFIWTEDNMPLFKNVYMEVETIKIMGIGNSFSVDAMQFLYGILKDVGYDNVILANAYIGGCSLEKHWTNVSEKNAAYTYYRNVDGAWATTKDVELETILLDEKWDVITMQQNSANSGKIETYDTDPKYLSNLIDWVNTNKLNKSARLFWHMTWAYEEGYGGLSSYGKQMDMYNAICNAVQTVIVPRSEFTAIMPVGTVIQNMRTSFLGDTLNRDGTHLDNAYGRLAAGLMWVKVITGRSIDDVTYNPDKYIITPEIMAVAKEAVNNAYANPFTVTPSIYPPEETEEPTVPELDQTGVPAGYYRINPEMVDNSFYNSKGGTTARTTTGDVAKKYVSSKLFTKADLPNGTIIEIASGWQYRSEGWITETTKNDDSTRPGNVQTARVTIDDAWWGDFTIRAFNVCPYPSAEITSFAEARDALKIYVPVQ